VSGLLLRVSGFLLRVDAVADARHGVNDPRFAEAFTQRRDSDAHRVGERVGVLIPRAFQELFGADDSAFGGDEDFEHGELFPGQRDVAVFTWPARFPVARIDQILVRGVEAENAWTLPATGSDHLPVAAGISW